MKWTPWLYWPEDRNSGRLEWYASILGRVTWQASAKNKFNVTFDEQRACNCGSVSAGQSHEYYLSSYRFEPNRLFQATWSSPVTSRLLIEAGTAATISQWNMFSPAGRERGRREHRRPGDRPVLRLGGDLPRPPQLSQSIHAARLAVCTSPARTTSRPASRMSCR